MEIVRGEFGDEHTTNPLAAFAVMPRRISFETQEMKEQIVLLLRKHWVTNTPWIVLIFALALVPMFSRINVLFSFLPARFQFIVVVIWYMIGVAIFLENFLSWYFNVYLITDERIIDIDFYSLIYKHISEAKIDRIQDISYSQGGIVQAMFNYGTVRIQTAGEVPEIAFESVPQPARIAKILNQLMLQEEQENYDGRAN